MNTLGQWPPFWLTTMPLNWVPGLNAPKPSSANLQKRPTVGGVSEEGKNEKVISLEELELGKESAFDVPNEGRAPSF